MVNDNLASPWPIFSRESAEIVSGGKSGGCADSILSHLILSYHGLSLIILDYIYLGSIFISLELFLSWFIFDYS